MRRLELQITELHLDSEAGPASPQDLQRLLERVLLRLQEKLAALPPARQAALKSVSLERLELDGLLPGELLGPRGIERLADGLYRQIEGMHAQSGPVHHPARPSAAQGRS